MYIPRGDAVAFHANCNCKRGYMRLRFALASLILACAAGAVAQPSAAPTCADLHLVPAVRECKAVSVVSIGGQGKDSGPELEVRQESLDKNYGDTRLAAED